MKKSYRSYLEEWESRFGTAEWGNTYFYHNGKKVPYPINKLSEQQFDYHVKELKRIERLIDTVYQIGGSNEERLVELFNQAFPHELVLLK